MYLYTRQNKLWHFFLAFVDIFLAFILLYTITSYKESIVIFISFILKRIVDLINTFRMALQIFDNIAISQDDFIKQHFSSKSEATNYNK